MPKTICRWQIVEKKIFFPYDQKKLRKESEDKINEIKFRDKNIYNILKELTYLNKRLKNYKKQNVEKEAKIGIELASEDEKGDTDIIF